MQNPTFLCAVDCSDIWRLLFDFSVFDWIKGQVCNTVTIFLILLKGFMFGEE